MTLIRSFLETCIEKKLTPIILMFDAMKRAKAFIYVQTDRQYGLEYSYRKYFTAAPDTVQIEKDPHLERLGNELPEALVNYLEAKKNLLGKLLLTGQPHCADISALATIIIIYLFIFMYLHLIRLYS